MSSQKMVTEAMQVIQVLQQAQQQTRARMAGDGTEGGGDDDELTMEDLQSQIALLSRDLKKHTAKSAAFMTEKVMDESIEAAMALQIEEVKAQHKNEMNAFRVQVQKDVSAQVAEAKEQFQGLLDEAKTDMRRQIAQIKEAAKEDAEKQVADLVALVEKAREEITLCIVDTKNNLDAARDSEGVSTVARLAEMTIAIQRHACAMKEHCTTEVQEREDAIASMTKSICAQNKRFKEVLEQMTESHQAFTAACLDMRTKDVFATSARQLMPPPQERGAVPRAPASRGGGRRQYEPGDFDDIDNDGQSVRSSRPSAGREAVGVSSRSGRWVDAAVSSSDEHAYHEDDLARIEDGVLARIEDGRTERRLVGRQAATGRQAANGPAAY
jgi:hypothetical protein